MGGVESPQMKKTLIFSILTTLYVGSIWAQEVTFTKEQLIEQRRQITDGAAAIDNQDFFLADRPENRAAYLEVEKAYKDASFDRTLREYLQSNKFKFIIMEQDFSLDYFIDTSVDFQACALKEMGYQKNSLEERRKVRAYLDEQRQCPDDNVLTPKIKKYANEVMSCSELAELSSCAETAILNDKDSLDYFLDWTRKNQENPHAYVNSIPASEIKNLKNKFYESALQLELGKYFENLKVYVANQIEAAGGSENIDQELVSLLQSIDSEFAVVWDENIFSIGELEETLQLKDFGKNSEFTTISLKYSDIEKNIRSAYAQAYRKFDDQKTAEYEAIAENMMAEFYENDANRMKRETDKATNPKIKELENKIKEIKIGIENNKRFLEISSSNADIEKLNKEIEALEGSLAKSEAKLSSQIQKTIDETPVLSAKEINAKYDQQSVEVIKNIALELEDLKQLKSERLNEVQKLIDGDWQRAAANANQTLNEINNRIEELVHNKIPQIRNDIALHEEANKTKLDSYEEKKAELVVKKAELEQLEQQQIEASLNAKQFTEESRARLPYEAYTLELELAEIEAQLTKFQALIP